MAVFCKFEQVIPYGCKNWRGRRWQDGSRRGGGRDPPGAGNPRNGNCLGRASGADGVVGGAVMAGSGAGGSPEHKQNEVKYGNRAH